MSADPSANLLPLIERAGRGDEAAFNDLLTHAYDRLLRLARHIFRHDFARLARRHQTESVLHEALLRLKPPRDEETRWKTPAEFFRFSAVVIRRTLVDLARRHALRDPEAPPPVADDSGAAPGEAADDASGDPVALAMWTEFHEQVDRLPEDERGVVDLHWYHGLSQAETARLLGLHEKAVSRLWLSARLKLASRTPVGEETRAEGRESP